MFCRAGRPAGMADEKGNVVSMLHHKIDRSTRGKGELKKADKGGGSNRNERSHLMFCCNKRR